MSGQGEPRPAPELSGLLRELAAEDLPAVIEAARDQARVRVQSVLADALAAEMLSGASSPAPDPPTQEAGEGVYVLCVIDATDDLPAEVRGIGGTLVRPVTQGELAAIVCDVPLAEFGEHALREHLQDLEWLERTARAHEAALEAIGDTATLVPLRLCTVFHAESGVRELLHRETDRLIDALAHLRGRQEWGVKVFAGEPPAEAAEAADSGAAYLRRRQDDRDRRANHAEAVHAAISAIHAALSQLANDARSNPPQRAEVSGGTMVLNGAYLVPDDRLDDFLARVAELHAEHVGLGLELELTGPWPAYNFVPDAIGVA